LEYRNPPKGIEVLDDNVNAIDVRLSGPSRLVRRLEATDISAAIDLSDWNAGERTYSISPDNLHVPYGVNVTTITPNKVRLSFESTQHKVVPIRPRLVGKVAEGFLVDTVECHPSLAQIEGPGGHLSAVQSISTDSIDVDGRSESFKRVVSLFIEDPLVRFSTDPETNVEIKIVPASLGKD
jgi:YbbR domain-containing protein